MTDTEKRFEITSFALHLLAMAFMLCDHLWATVVRGGDWLTWIGRIAFPIFAFMTAEGFFYTKNFKKYLLRMLVFALISEIPFNLMYGGSFIYPFHQNVMWTFLISMLCMKGIELVRRKNKILLTVFAAVGLSAVGFLAGTVFMTDYYGFGVLTVLLFYIFRGREWWRILAVICGMYIINGILLGGLSIPIALFGLEFDFPQQSLAMLALIPIYLYRGKQGPYNKLIKYSFYAFYPAHMLILSLISLYR